MPRKRKYTNEQVLEVIKNFQKENDESPTVVELTDILRLGSTRTSMYYLRELERIGSITRVGGARGIRLYPDGKLDPNGWVNARARISGEGRLEVKVGRKVFSMPL